MSNKNKGNIILLLTAAIWGTGFISQKLGNEYLPPMTFNSLRQLMAVIVMLPIVTRNLRKSGYLSPVKNSASQLAYRKKRLLTAGLLTGLFLLFGSATQQMGLVTVDAGKSGFISDLYIVLVPVFAAVTGEKIRRKSIVCIVIALAGFAVMSLDSSLGSISTGDWLTLASAAGFSAEIVAINYFVDKDNALPMSILQSFVCGSFGIVIALLAEDPTWAAVGRCMPVLLYQTLVPTTMGYTLQMIGQRFTDPSTAALIMSTEAIFASLFGMLFLGEMMSAREVLGSAIIFAAIIIGQIEKKPADFQKPADPVR